jgi:hypothetical protein
MGERGLEWDLVAGSCEQSNDLLIFFWPCIIV